ncbi:MAG: spermine/spermidine synthase domain-containing protein, partial [Deltaproteobacteria bacterium]
ALVSGLVLGPRAGLWVSCGGAAATELAAAAAALVIQRGGAPGPAACPHPTDSTRPNVRGRTLWAAALSGAAGLAAELLWLRILLPWLGGTSRALATLLGLYLTGMGLGAVAASRLARGSPRPRAALALAATAVALGLSTWAGSSVLDGWVRSQQPGNGFALALLLILPGAIGFGAATPLLFAAHAPGRSDGDAVAGISWAAGLGSAVGALLAPFILAPSLGGRMGLFVAAGLCLAAALPLAHGWTFAALGASAAALGAVTLLTPAHGPLPPGLRLIERAEGPLAEAWAVEEPLERARGLLVNGRLREGGTALEARVAEALQAHVPLLWHPNPKRLLWLGVGTGVSLAAAERHPLVTTDAVELLPSVLELLPAFAPYNDPARRATLVADDARAFLTSTGGGYDVIVGELFFPWEAGAGGLYSLEQFRAARARLAPGGLFCQWLPLYLLPPEALSIVAASLRGAFPYTAALSGLMVAEQPQLALCGAEQPLTLPVGSSARVEALRDGGALSHLLGEPDAALASMRLFGDDGMRALAGDAPMERDLRPRVELLAADDPASLHADWTDNLARVRALATPGGPWAEARLALLDEALALGRGDLRRAVALQERAVGLAPTLGESALAGLRLEGPLRRERRYAEAEALLGRALDRLGPDARTLFMAGTLRLRAGDARAAEPLLRQSLELDPDSVEGLLHLGLSVEAQGRRGEADGYFRRALALDPGNARALRYLGP